jgi:periplasmic protein TonB
MVRLINVAVALLLSAAVTFGLFFLMQFLISMDAVEPERGETIKIADITMPDIEIEVQRVQPKPEVPDEPEELPDLPEPEFSVNAPTAAGIQVARVNVDVGDLGSGASISASDAEYLPIVVIQPQYPNRALQRGIEGWCQVMFTVDENGGVLDPVVVDADPPEIFDSSSLRAVTRFKFNPRTVNGQAVRTPGVQYVFRYNLEQE